MRILFLNKDWSFPVNSGHRLRTWNFINALYQDHELSLLCFDKDKAETSLSELERYFVRYWGIRRSGNRAFSRMKNTKNLLRGLPWEIGNTFDRDFEKKFLEVMAEHTFDVVFARYINMGKYLIKHIKNIRAKTIIDLDDLEFVKAERQMHVRTFKNEYEKHRTHFNNWQFRNYYKKLRLIDRATVCSYNDAEKLKTFGVNANISVVPNAIEVKKYNAIQPFSEDLLAEKIILFCGVLNYEANEEGILWFLKKIFPRISALDPAVKLHIVGLYPTKEIKSYHNGASICVFENVPAVAPYYEACALVIVPIRIAGGTRIKILEAIACKRPVVSTTIGAEGLGLAGGKHYLNADTEDEFAGQCLAILRNPEKARGLTEAGYEVVNAEFDVTATQEKILSMFQEVTGRA